MKLAKLHKTLMKKALNKNTSDDVSVAILKNSIKFRVNGAEESAYQRLASLKDSVN